MATGVKPRDEEISFTRSDLEAIQDAMKNKKFRDLFAAYCEEVRDPANQALYQKEMIQLEKERGYDITFINPKGGYVIKTSVAGDRKAFINICSNENVDRPTYAVQEVDGQKGMNWQIPYSVIPPREDFDHKKQRCVIYDVVFHPDTLRMAEVNRRFRDLVNKTAFDALQKAYDIYLDSNNLRYPKSQYKGLTMPAVIRKEDPNYKPSVEEETSELSPEILDTLYPQHMYPEKTAKGKLDSDIPKEPKRKQKNNSKEFCHESDKGYTIPKYTIKQQKSIDLQEFTLHKDCKQYSAIPNQIIVEINLPLLSSTKDCILDVKEKSLSLISDKPAKYKLDISLPYCVNDECGNAKFDKTKCLLIVTLPVIRKNSINANKNSLKVDSGVESEENTSSLSDDDNVKRNLIEELSSESTNLTLVQSEKNLKMEKESFLDPSLAYLLPSYTHNVLDDTIAFTFHVKNTEPDSVKIKKDNNAVYIKFTSVGSGFVPIHYAAVIVFDDEIKFDNVDGEAWDNNVILQLELSSEIPRKFWIGLNKNNLVCVYFDVAHIKRSVKMDTDDSISNSQQLQEEIPAAVVEVINLGTETNIVVSSKPTEHDNDIESLISPKESEIIWKDDSSEPGAKSILRKPITMMRSFSESSAGDVASSMDYISSDCIPEESSFKKTVRFNDVIARKFYRYNSSIEGQRKKNQRKKNKKRNQEMRKSESEAEDDNVNIPKTSKPRPALKQRRDSGLADTSDAETECKNNSSAVLEDNNTPDKNNAIENGRQKSILKIVDNNGNIKNESEPIIWKSETKPVNVSLSTKSKKSTPLTCDNIKHNTDLYNPDKLNKGQYLEVSFKNDLIFDLDM